MAFVIPTLDEENAFLSDLMSHLFGADDPDVSEGSPNWLLLRTIAAGVTGNHAHLFAVFNDLLPDTSLEAELARWGNIVGVVKKGATPARKSKALRVFGANGTNIGAGLVLSHNSGLSFETSSVGVIAAPPGYVDVDVTAIDVGSKTRLNAGEQLTFSAPPAGAAAIAVLQLALDEDGTDVEKDGDYRARILSRFSSPPAGGRADDYVQWALETVGIASAYCYPLRAGVGCVDLAALHTGSGSDRLLLAGEVTALQAAIDALRPVSMKTFRVLTVTASALQNIEITIVDDGALENAFDWDDTAPPTVLAWNAGTRTLQFSGGARPASLRAGHRLINGNGATGKERVVESLSGADSVVLEVDTAGDGFVATDTVYSGGPLVQQVRAAVQALADMLGPANPDAKRYGPWEGNLRPGAISRMASSVKGVLDVTVVARGATVVANDPAYPDDGTVELLVLGRILARKQH